MKSARRGEKAWANLFSLLICYWGAFFANATFDVFLEGPMGGIWFWSLYGIGMASVRIYRYRPEILVNNKDSIPRWLKSLEVAGRDLPFIALTVKSTNRPGVCTTSSDV